MKKRIVSLITCGIILLTACGKNEQLNKTPEFIMGNSEEAFYTTISYADTPHEKNEQVVFENERICRAGKDGFYTLRRCYTETMDNKIEFYSPDTQSYSVLELLPSEWGLENGEIWSFDVIESESEMKYVYAVGAGQTKFDDDYYRPTQSFIVFTDEKGNMLSKFETTDSAENGIFFQNVFADEKGCIYLVENSQYSLRAYTDKGELILKHEIPKDSENALGSIGTPFSSDKGNMIIPIREENTTKLFSLNDKEQLVELASIETDFFSKWYMLTENQIFYLNKDNLIKWDVSNGQCRIIYNFSNAGIESSANTDLMLGEDGKLYLRVITKKGDWIETLCADKLESETPVAIAALSGDNKLLRRCAAEFSRKNPLNPIAIMQETSENAQGDVEKVLIELMAGKGPDLLYVSYEDMKTLNEKGALENLTGYIEKSNLEQLIPAALEMGTLSGELYGIVPNVQVNTLLTTNQIWEQDSWTIEDVMRLAQENDSVQELISYQFQAMDPETILYYLLAQDMNHIKYIDWEQEKSLFLENEFDDLLIFLQKYSQNIDNSCQGEEKVFNGTSLAFYDPLIEPYMLFRKLSKLGDDGHAVGWPSATGKGNYIASDGILVVNQKSEKKETIRAFLNMLLSLEEQAYLEDSISVRQDILDEVVVYQESTGDYYWKLNDTKSVLLDKKEDGTTFTEEYQAFLQNCTPSYYNEAVMEIIAEEVSGFFNGELDPMSVTKVIDNRIQLYLDEG